MKKIIYFEPDFESEVSPLDMSDAAIKLLLAKKFESGVDYVHIYDSIEDFATAFNNEYISDLGYLRVIETRDSLQIFKEGGNVTEEERGIIEKRVKILGSYDDKANDYTAFDLATRDLGMADYIIRILNKINEDNPNWYVGNPYEEYVYVD